MLAIWMCVTLLGVPMEGDNRVCTNKLGDNEFGCMGYMELKITEQGVQYLKCPLCGFTKIINEYKIVPN